MPVWCAQTWAQWRWHGRMIQDACTGAAAALSAQWTWALPQIPHRPAGWRHVTLHPPGQTKVGFAQQFCSALGGWARFSIHKEPEWKRGGRGAVTQAAGVLWHSGGMFGVMSLHSCLRLFAFRRPGDFYFDCEWISGGICVHASAPVMTRDCRLDTSEEMNAESVQTTAIEFLYEFTVENYIIYSFSAFTGTWWRF